MATFLNPEFADAMGLVGMGGDLSPRRLLQAYRRGIFPWYDENYPVCWWSPDPRAIIELDGLHISRRLRRTIRSGQFSMSIDRAFGAVIRGCGDRGEGTWIVPDMIAAYEKLHDLGWAHSVEVYRCGELAGGLYGVAIGGFFAGESMFSRQTDASKVGLAFTVARLKERGFQLFDIQFISEHTASLGARETPRAEYLVRLGQALACQASFVD